MDRLRLLDWQMRKDWAVLVGKWDVTRVYCYWGSAAILGDGWYPVTSNAKTYGVKWWYHASK